MMPRRRNNQHGDRMNALTNSPRRRNNTNSLMPPPLDPTMVSQELFAVVASRDYEQLCAIAARVAQRAVERYQVAAMGQVVHNTNNTNPAMKDNHDPSKMLFAELLCELSAFIEESEKELAIASGEPSRACVRGKVEVSADAERVLREALIALSETRPPANFVVYAEDDEQPTASLLDDDDDEHGPPIFDGSVANATPQSGGAGTLLHLACAIDEPLALAFGLAMGADARASHTAFRRLMIHEAACNGSIQCLTLLLELGRTYGGPQAAHHDANARLPPRLRTTRGAPTVGTFELPFMPRRLERSELLAPVHLFAAAARNPRNHFLGYRGNEENCKNGATPTPMLMLLQEFRNYSRQVKAGEISELDAARKVLKLASLSDVSKMSLARSCSFDTDISHSSSSSSSPELFLRSRAAALRAGMPTAPGNSDGHGNSPLHWAAFKNETECVQLLLNYGANPNARAHPSGWTPLHDAAYSNSTDAIALLVDAGAHVDARANSGATPLCFAAQEDSSEAAELLLRKGADMTNRCAGGPVRDDGSIQPPSAQSRFSGYTPLHYCAHYNAHKAARVLLHHRVQAKVAMEIPDLNDRLPIHVAVARGSSMVLRELLHAGARVETRKAVEQEIMAARMSRTTPPPLQQAQAAVPPPLIQVQLQQPPQAPAHPSTPRRRLARVNSSSSATSSSSSTPVSSPVLRSMIPSQPVTSSKPWNCLTQESIDECRALIAQAEMAWCPERHALFTPNDRRAVRTLLVVGKRLEQDQGVYTDLWPTVLSFCGRGWFDPEEPDQKALVSCNSDDMQADMMDTEMSDGPSGTGTGAMLYNDSLSLPSF